MKLRTLLFAGLVALPACSKPNNVPALQKEADTIPAFYQPQLDVLAARSASLGQAVEKIPGTVAGRDVAQRALGEADEELGKLRAAGPSVKQQASALAAKQDLGQLIALAANTEERYEEGTTIAHSDLELAAGWVAHASRQEAPAAAPAITPEAPPTPDGSAANPEPANAERANAAPANPPTTNQTPSATGQPAPAAAPTPQK